MKKILLPLISSILILNLSACATTAPIHYTQSEKAGFSGNLASPLVDKSMNENDRMQLVKWIGAAKPGSIHKWKNSETGNTFEFISHKIFLNGQGQPCHTYQIKANAGLFNKFQSTETACRNINGHWRLSE